jgi:hypothetical protein
VSHIKALEIALWMWKRNRSWGGPEWATLPAVLWAEVIGWLELPEYAAIRTTAQVLRTAAHMRSAHPWILDLPSRMTDDSIRQASLLSPVVLGCGSAARSADQLAALLSGSIPLRLLCLEVRVLSADIAPLGRLALLTSLTLDVEETASPKGEKKTEIVAGSEPAYRAISALTRLEHLSLIVHEQVADRTDWYNATTSVVADALALSIGALTSLCELTIEPLPIRHFHQLCKSASSHLTSLEVFLRTNNRDVVAEPWEHLSRLSGLVHLRIDDQAEDAESSFGTGRSIGCVLPALSRLTSLTLSEEKMNPRLSFFDDIQHAPPGLRVLDVAGYGGWSCVEKFRIDDAELTYREGVGGVSLLTDVGDTVTWSPTKGTALTELWIGLSFHVSDLFTSIASLPSVRILGGVSLVSDAVDCGVGSTLLRELYITCSGAHIPVLLRGLPRLCVADFCVDRGGTRVPAFAFVTLAVLRFLRICWQDDGVSHPIVEPGDPLECRLDCYSLRDGLRVPSLRRLVLSSIAGRVATGREFEFFSDPDDDDDDDDYEPALASDVVTRAFDEMVHKCTAHISAT